MSLAAQIAKFYGQGKEQRNGAGFLTMCPVHGNSNTPSLSVTDNNNGDVDVFCHGAGCSWKDIKDRFRQDGLLPEWQPARNDRGHTTKKITKKQQQVNNKPGNEQAQDEPLKEEPDSKIWKLAKREHLEHVSEYLATRNITMPLPACVKFTSYTDKKTKEKVNAAVFAASKPGDKNPKAVQRLFIDLETHKKIGAAMGGPCRTRGVWFDRKGDLSTIIIGEGIETTLSAMQATGKNGVATLSWAGTENLIIPKETHTIYLLVDSDPVKDKESISMPGQKSAYFKAREFASSREDRKAFLVSPDDTCFSDAPNKLDFNDLLLQDPTGESIRARMEVAVEINDLEWEPPQPPPEEEREEDSLNDPKEEAELFDRYVFLTSENKIIDTVGHDIKESMMIERSFTLLHAGKLHRYFDHEGSLKVMPLAKFWLESPKKKVAAGLKYKPGEPALFTNGCGRTYYNVFRFPYASAPPMPPEELAARIKPWDTLMDRVFHQHRPYLNDWLAFTIQHPAKRAGIMPLCISEVGLGKSLLVEIMSYVVGLQNFSNANVFDVTGLGKAANKWGDWIFNKKLSCIEEIAPENEVNISYQVLDSLKDIITNSTLPLNLKGGRNGTFTIHSNIIGFSNYHNCVKIPLQDRRLFVVDSTGQENLRQEQYDELYTWKEDPKNITAVFQSLLAHEISSEFIPGQAKMTKAKQALQLDSRSTMQTAFDIVVNQYPCDLITSGELKLAVAEAMKFIEGDEGDLGDFTDRNWNRDKQYQAILRSSTTLVAEGKRIRVQRLGGNKLAPSRIRALRNGQEWSGASLDQVKDSMYVSIPHQWISADDADDVPF